MITNNSYLCKGYMAFAKISVALVKSSLVFVLVEGGLIHPQIFLHKYQVLFVFL